MKRLLCLAILTALSTSGCGPGVGDEMVRSRDGLVYYKASDLDSGGGPHRVSDMIVQRKAATIDSGDHYRVLAVESKNVKIEITKGAKEGSTGWIPASDLKEDARK